MSDEPIPESEPESEPDAPIPETEKPLQFDIKGATLRSFTGGWHLIEKGSWQVSVSPDGLLMLPRHLHPSEVQEFCEAAMAAAGVAAQVRLRNADKTTPQPTLEDLQAVGNAIIATGEPPPGAVRMQTVPRQGDYSMIGRPKHPDPRAPRQAQEPRPPIPGARRGRSK